MCIMNYQDLDEVLPNRNKFTNDLFDQIDIYTTGSAPTPTAPTPTAPTPTASCQDSPFRFKVIKDGNKITRDCTWVANRATNSRCKLDGVKNQCPSTCNRCSVCADSTLRYQFEFNGRKITRDCSWVANRSTNIRCGVSGMENTCRLTCGTCSV